MIIFSLKQFNIFGRIELRDLRNKRQRTPKGQSKMDNPENTEGAIKMDNPEKSATQDIQDEEKQNKNNTQYVLNPTVRKQTQIT